MKNENMKMRVNNHKDSVCDFCNEKWKDVPEMYDMMLMGNIYTICKACTQEMFMKILKADCLYNGKLKSAEDIARKNRFEERHGHSIHVTGYQIK